jgi:hypothetical protein
MHSEHFWNNVKDICIIVGTAILFAWMMGWVLPGLINSLIH